MGPAVIKENGSILDEKSLTETACISFFRRLHIDDIPVVKLCHKDVLALRRGTTYRQASEHGRLSICLPLVSFLEVTFIPPDLMFSTDGEY